ncbi:gag protein [Tanacetum coccineum]
MAEETLFTISVDAFGDGPNRSDPKEPPVDTNISNPTPKNHTRGHTPENTFENASGDPVKQFIVQNFKQINAMYSAFLSKRKEINPTSIIENNDHPILEPWQLKSGGQPEEAIQQIPKDATLADQIRDYDMPDGLKVPTNLVTYDGTSDPDDHLTIFMGTMDVHKLPEPAWCLFFHITLCGAARFWHDNLPSESINRFYELRDKFWANFLQQRRFQKDQAEILGIQQRSDESLKDYLSEFGKETLHMTDRSDGMMIRAFISGLRP